MIFDNQVSESPNTNPDPMMINYDNRHRDRDRNNHHRNHTDDMSLTMPPNMKDRTIRRKLVKLVRV